MNPILFIFRRDLRLEDNTALIAALNSDKPVITCFILNPKQLEQNPYRGEPAVYFLYNSLLDLKQQLEAKGGKLYIFHGEPTNIIENLVKQQNIEEVYINQDYTPFSKQRDVDMQAMCSKHNVKFNSYHDALLSVPGTVHKDDGLPYTVYTPFARRARLQPVLKPQTLPSVANWFTAKIEDQVQNLKEIMNVQPSEHYVLQGGRAEGLTLLRDIKKLGNYKEQRDFPILNATSHLASHHKFGTISIRETYLETTKFHGVDSTIINELYWRDFFTHIVHHFPHVLSGAFRPQYNKLQWNNSREDFNKWCNGQTGFPIVDAGMRELNKTGLMHNRVRMIVASFLVKDLHINWQWGERYFAQKLLDYDPAVNNGNWQWAASTGCDAQPYFRIFNPWRQQERFDAKCEYVKHWVPELQELTSKEIHNLYKSPADLFSNYPEPMIDHSKESAAAKELYKSCKPA